ncbi:MAG: hypothetical protein Q8Q31_04155 [Nanoarchaeota archaeon]|nr:hypothetical protein [Nanoarchaeota archaeon]
MELKDSKWSLSDREYRTLKTLKTPAKIQDFLNDLKMNYDDGNDTCMSPRMVLCTGKAHCVEGAILAAAALRLQGHPPLIVDLEATKDDYDHVIAVFQKNGYWGALGKTAHAVLRYREPIYRDIRELVMSFFHEYFLTKGGKKTLRTFSEPLDLSIFDSKEWMASEKDVWYIPEKLVSIKHFPILTRGQIYSLRRADSIEIEAGKIIEPGMEPPKEK